MTIAKVSEIAKEKVRLARKYPILVEDTIGVDSGYQRLHWHDVLEINHIKAGSGYYIINGKRFEFQQGDILLINSNDLHCAYETKDLIMQVVTFDGNWLISSLRLDPEILNPFREMNVHFTNLLEREHPQIDKLRGLLLALQTEHEHHERSYTSMVYAYLLQFLALVNRDFRTPCGADQHAISERQLEKIRHVLHEMEQNFAYGWTLEELAALVFLSPSRFSEIFKRAVGMPPLLYLIHLRLEHAVLLLEANEMKITDIALECGFRTLTNFNRLFKKHIGVTPMTSRKH
ncbi:AraC-like DNA-binding protein [Paenibacillus phyllosphaerae]|uniref:AraC-like DNA-binding protein n=1 Tax=Paenibacillus phyllosphaerae TaxID=274593 RepID=A0A7W5AWX7_9BACL|nr:AraC family transcriptional regulator [Paenibacillus phyllosphaerae]MBB3110102.1 AraC-like DNA-binding protein [Paenibacillus phyllosphaerae]